MGKNVDGQGRQETEEGILTTEARLTPPNVHAPPGTGCSIAGHSAAQAVPAIRAGTNVVAAILQVGQGAHSMVAGLELGRRQQGAGLLCEPGWRARRTCPGWIGTSHRGL